MDSNQKKEIKKLANEFYQAAREYYDQEKFPEIYKMLSTPPEGSFRIQGPFLVLDDNVKTKENILVRQCVRSLGVELGSDEEIEELIWNLFWQIFPDTNPISNISESAEQFAERFLEDISRYEQRSYGYLAPNFVIEFSDQAQKIVIGPIVVIQKEYFLPEENKISKDKTRWQGAIVIPSEIGVRMKFNFSISDAHILLGRPQSCWHISSIKAARRNAEEKAIWLINIAISLLRLCYPTTKEKKYPQVGDIEEMPLIEPKQFWFGIEEKGIVLDRIDKEDESTNRPIVSAGPSTPVSSSIRRIPCTYLVDETVVALTEEQKFKDRAQVIFNPSKNSLAERFGQGGWLTRGRQTADRAERFLFFFTAIEALLSSDDKSAPVVQTISRYAATILHADPLERADFARQFRSLYRVRSGLVHEGKRNVSQKQTMEAQRIAEELYKTVMENYPLDSMVNKFQESLSKASYGSPWPLSNSNRSL